MEKENNKQTFTLTFGDQAENHAGMQIIGELSKEGFTLKDLFQAKKYFKNQNSNLVCDIYDLRSILEDNQIKEYNIEKAFILIVRNGLDGLLSPSTSEDFYNEQYKLEKDKKALMKGRVVNKKARYNLCFSENNQEPDYEKGQGRIIAFNDVPLLNKLRLKWNEVIGEKGKNLVAEGNYYYDVDNCFINFHGDTERTKVIAVRVGESFPLYYQWYYKTNPIGDRIEFNLNNGDIYFMSEKAVGRDWKKRNIFTLRHAAGKNI